MKKFISLLMLILGVSLVGFFLPTQLEDLQDFEDKKLTNLTTILNQTADNEYSLNVNIKQNQEIEVIAKIYNTTKFVDLEFNYLNGTNILTNTTTNVLTNCSCLIWNSTLTGIIEVKVIANPSQTLYFDLYLYISNFITEDNSVINLITNILPYIIVLGIAIFVIKYIK